MTPFAFVDGQAYLVLNFRLDHPHFPIATTDLIGEMDHDLDLSDLLLLRPLSRLEARLLASYTSEAEAEAWAKINAPRAKRGRRK